MFVYSTTYLIEIVGISRGHPLLSNTLEMGAALLVLRRAGALSDRIGRKPLLLGREH